VTYDRYARPAGSSRAPMAGSPDGDEHTEALPI
jgi:hypothetical protein